MGSYKPCILTPRQFLFMQAHHEQIERERHYVGIVYSSGWFEAFSKSDSYNRYFGDMTLDDVLDRYEDTPGYSDKLRKQLFSQLQADMENNPVLDWYLTTT